MLPLRGLKLRIALPLKVAYSPHLISCPTSSNTRKTVSLRAVTDLEESYSLGLHIIQYIRWRCHLQKGSSEKIDLLCTVCDRFVILLPFLCFPCEVSLPIIMQKYAAKQ